MKRLNRTGLTERLWIRRMPEDQYKLLQELIKKMKLCIENDADVYVALRNVKDLDDAVPRVLDVLEHDPLASAGFFRGDLLRALMDIPTEFWGANGSLFRRYQSVVRAGALARRALPTSERMEFWAATAG